MSKRKPVQTRSQGALQARLRGGAGAHGDRRTKRQRSRSDRERTAIQDARHH